MFGYLYKTPPILTWHVVFRWQDLRLDDRQDSVENIMFVDFSSDPLFANFFADRGNVLVGDSY